jgi:hypothetical protein
MAIERVNYFTGLLLDESDFKLEQNYHLLMRRMLNFGLFMPGILFGLGVHREAPDRVSIDPGMAIDRDEAQNQGREIVLTESRTIPLNTFNNEEPVNNGDQVYITISYSKAKTTPRAPLDIASRITEEPIIELIKPVQESEPTEPGFPEDQNLKIILAKVTKGDLSIPDLRERQLVQLRLGAEGPIVTSLSFRPLPRQGSNVEMTINGANLADNPHVVILDATNQADTQITATTTGASSNTVLKVNLDIRPTADLGARRVRVRTDRGTTTTDPQGETVFTVIPPEPVFNAITPQHGRETVPVHVTITGSNLDARPIVTIRRNDDTLDPDIDVATPDRITPSEISTTLTINRIAEGPRGRRVHIQTEGGEISSPVNSFMVRAVPEIKDILPPEEFEGREIEVRGSDIRDDSLNPGDDATGTTVRFVDPADETRVALGVEPKVLADLAPPDDPNQGPQRITVTVPSRANLPRTVEVTLEIEGVTSPPKPFSFR